MHEGAAWDWGDASEDSARTSNVRGIRRVSPERTRAEVRLTPFELGGSLFEKSHDRLFEIFGLEELKHFRHHGV